MVRKRTSHKTISAHRLQGGEHFHMVREPGRRIPSAREFPMFRRMFSFRTRHQPYMVRLSYLHELRSAFTFPLAASLAEGAFAGVVAAKGFNANPLLISVITAAPMFGNIMALIWADLAMGRRKVPMVNMLQTGVVLMIASVALCALLPPGLAGWVFATQIIITRLLASGIVTIRSAIWRANYPRSVRGQVTSRIAVVATTVLASTTLVGSFLLDQNPQAYVYLYPAAALIGVVGIWQFSKIRVRGEILLRRQEEQVRVVRPENLAQTDEGSVINYMPPIARRPFQLLRDTFRDAYRLLRQDPAFREYQRYQFITGFSFMMYTPALVVMVSTEMTNRQEQYVLATFIVQVLPLLTSLIAAQAWAPLFDRVHVTRFRIYQMGVAVLGLLLLFVGAMLGNDYNALAMVALAQLVIGISNGGGILAWNLGHNDFCPADKAANYMAVHVMLTGLRGCMAPFLGATLYMMPWVGRNIFLLSMVFCFLGTLGFYKMSRQAPSKVVRTA